MSKVINFDARDFKADKTCENNVFSKHFTTDSSGENVIVYEIGDWEWNWTQICCDKKLEKNTDYVFRFVIVGGYCDTQDETSQFIICPFPDGTLTSDDWDSRYSYNLSHSAFKPVLSKKTEDGLLRLYEIPFNTFDCEYFRFAFVASHAVAKIYPPKELSAYAELEDMTYEQAFAKTDKGNSSFPFSMNAVVDLSGARLSQRSLDKILNKLGFNPVIDLSGAVILDSDDEEEDPDGELCSPVSE
ncbi:MAG: hypothetical protein ACI4JW_01475 [Oscillospiraceae bacterium]